MCEKSGKQRKWKKVSDFGGGCRATKVFKNIIESNGKYYELCDQQGLNDNLKLHKQTQRR